MKKHLLAAAGMIFALILSSTPSIAADDWIVKDSPHDVSTTADNFVAAVEKAGAKVFARIDHAQGAKSIGTELEGTTLILFGNPKLGTPIIQADRKAGIDLPVRLLIWSEGGKTQMGALSPEALKARYDIEGADKSFEMMGGAINKLMDAAAK